MKVSDLCTCNNQLQPHDRARSCPVKVTAEFAYRPIRGGPISKWQKEVTVTIDDRGWVHMDGGPTGFESFELKDALEYHTGRGWMANAGGYGWSECYVPEPEFQRILEAFGGR